MTAHTLNPPAQGVDVVLAIEGTYPHRTRYGHRARRFRIVRLGHEKRRTTNRVRDVLLAASTQWNVLEIVYPKRVRSTLFQGLARDGLPVVPWSASVDVRRRPLMSYTAPISIGAWPTTTTN